MFVTRILENRKRWDIELMDMINGKRIKLVADLYKMNSYEMHYTTNVDVTIERTSNCMIGPEFLERDRSK